MSYCVVLVIKFYSQFTHLCVRGLYRPVVVECYVYWYIVVDVVVAQPQLYSWRVCGVGVEGCHQDILCIALLSVVMGLSNSYSRLYQQISNIECDHYGTLLILSVKMLEGTGGCLKYRSHSICHKNVSVHPSVCHTHLNG